MGVTCYGCDLVGMGLIIVGVASLWAWLECCRSML